VRVRHNFELGKAEEIAEKLRDDIANGRLLPGTKLPSERDLCKEFDASRMTVRRAIQMIEGEGLVVRYGARGTFIAAIREKIVVDKGREAISAVAATELRTSGSFLKDMERQGRKPFVHFLEQPALVAATDEIAAHLRLAAGTLVLKRYRLQGVENTPYRLIESYYPSDLFGELLTLDIGDMPLFMWLQERHHQRAVHAQEELVARLAQPQERQLLHVASNAAVIAIDRTVWSDQRRPVEWAKIIAVASLYVFSYEYDIEWSKEQTGGDL
jgi:GntR family transcriptional regulator